MHQPNRDPENPGNRQKQMTGWRWTKHQFWKLVRTSLWLLDAFISGFFWLQISPYRCFTGKEPLFISDKRFEQDNMITELEQSEKELQEEVNCLEADITDQKVKIADLQSELRAERKTLENLRKENYDLKRDKEEALRRLSEAVSVKLRDNNPNIVDLNDQCRPTKLAEMFSELYDNEWTSAFALLEEQFTEVPAVVILLDTVMEAYYYCEKKLEEPWQILNKWFLNPNLTGSQQTVKWLKDSRKSLVLDKAGEVDEGLEELLSSICKVQEVEKIMLHGPVQNYTRKCVELCLLMVTTDPPVVLGCPGWIPSKPMTKKEKEKTKAKTKQQTVQEIRSGTNSDNITQQNNEDTVPSETDKEALIADQCAHNTDDRAAKTDKDSEIGTKQKEKEKEKKSEEKNVGSNTKSYGMLEDLKHTPNNQKQSTDADEALSDSPKVNKIEKEKKIETSSITSVNKDNDVTIEPTEQDRRDVNSPSDVPSAGQTSQPESDEAKEESWKATRKVEGSQREGDKTLGKGEEAKRKGEEEKKGKHRKEAGDKEDSTVRTDLKSTDKIEEDEKLVERQQFDKDMFKEYTTRGKYLEFVVWPAMYLHKGGPLLGKGVAQGTKEPKRKARQQLWSWRNVDA